MNNQGTIAIKNFQTIISNLDDMIDILKNKYLIKEIHNKKIGKLKKQLLQGKVINDRLLAEANRYGRLSKILRDDELKINQETLKRLMKGHFEGDYLGDKSDDIFLKLI